MLILIVLPKVSILKDLMPKFTGLLSEIFQPQTFVSDIDLYFCGAFIQRELSTETENVIIP